MDNILILRKNKIKLSLKNFFKTQIFFNFIFPIGHKTELNKLLIEFQNLGLTIKEFKNNFFFITVSNFLHNCMWKNNFNSSIKYIFNLFTGYKFFKKEKVLMSYNEISSNIKQNINISLFFNNSLCTKFRINCLTNYKTLVDLYSKFINTLNLNVLFFYRIVNLFFFKNYLINSYQQKIY